MVQYGFKWLEMQNAIYTQSVVEFSKLIFLIFSWVPLLGASPLGRCWPDDTSSPPRAGERLQAQ